MTGYAYLSASRPLQHVRRTGRLLNYRHPNSWAYSGLVAAACRRAPGEAVAAVDGTVAPRFEGNLGVLAALSADHSMHLSR